MVQVSHSTGHSQCGSPRGQVTQSAGHHSEGQPGHPQYRSPMLQVSHGAGHHRSAVALQLVLTVCLLVVAAAWGKLGNITLSEKSQTEKCLISDRKCPEYVDADRMVVDRGCGADCAVPT